MKPKRRPLTWKTKDGKVLRISEMTTEHLTNCIRMLERHAESREQRELDDAIAGISLLHGEMAQFEAEQGVIAMIDDEDEDVVDRLTVSSPIYRAMVDELERREMKPSSKALMSTPSTAWAGCLKNLP